jgi:hypothetical protein
VTRRLHTLSLLLVLGVMCAGAVADEGSTLLPAIPAAVKGDACVEPTDVIRRRHMDFLMHQRDDTVKGGIRGAKHSLVGCIDCHAQSDAQGAAIPVNAEGQFCQSCHGFAGVRMDCFECHATVPDGGQARTALPGWMSSPVVSVSQSEQSRLDR